MKRVWFAGMLSLTMLIASPGLAQIPPESGCASCHFANPNAPRRDHIFDWDRSPHGRNRVGCENCHGGNPKVFEGFLAHRGILPTRNQKSPVNPKNLPATCGSCHAAPLAAFRDSRHYELLQSGKNTGPTCSTCHGDTDGRVLSPKALASQCGSCHGPREAAPRAERVREVRDLYEGVAAVREQMKLAQSLVRRVEDKERRAELNRRYEEANAPLTRAINAGHKFVYDELRLQIADAQQRVGMLLSQLANRQ